MRVYALTILVLALAVYAWRNWFVSLCGLIVLGAFVRHPDMPTMVMGIQGANLWNMLFASIVLAWIAQRLVLPGQSRAAPVFVKVIVGLYVAVIILAFIRGVRDLANIHVNPGEAQVNTTGSFISDYFINCLKYVVVAVLLFSGARTRRNLLLASGAIIAQVVLLALMTIHYIPLGQLAEAGTTEQAESAFRTQFQQEIGFHSNDVGLVLVAGLWALVAIAPVLWRMRWWWKCAGLGAAVAIALAIGLTNSRASYVCTVAVGLVFGLLRWHKLLVVVPVAGLLVCMVSPSISGRLGLGVGEVSASGDKSLNWEDVSAGRVTNIWPPTIEQIDDAPLTGQGRLTILRTPMFYKISATEGTCPSHPHNAYLEILLDSGVMGLAIALAMFVGFPILAFTGRRKGDVILESATYAGLAGAVSLLVMGISGQSFWPREAVDLILCLYALMLAAYAIGQGERGPAWAPSGAVPTQAICVGAGER